MGKPLIAYSIEAALQSKYLTRTIVSTDDQEIAEISRSLGADVPFLRPKELAQDDSTSVDVVRHTLKWLEENEGKKYDYVMILQPTSPLRTAEDIDACIEKATQTGASSVMSMVKLHDMALKKLKKIKHDLILPLVEEEGQQSLRRTATESVYKRNTAIYLTRTSLIMEGKMFGDSSRPYIMPSERSIDINEPADLAMAEFFMRRKP